MMSPLVSTSWLAEQIGSRELCILDASFFLPADERDARAEFERAHIPGAQFFDLPEISDHDSPLPNMLPSPEKFAEKMAALGVGNDDHIVIYDNSPHHSSARAWWMLRVFGATQVSILNGGFHQWELEGRAIESGFVNAVAKQFRVSFDPLLIRDLSQMMTNLDSGAEQVVDARSEGRFSGTIPEPRPTVQPGHIPGSCNLPHERMFADRHLWKSAEILREEFENLNLDLNKPLAMTCGSGVTASVLAFAAHLAGADKVAVYDGSWSEWGSSALTPKARNE